MILNWLNEIPNLIFPTIIIFLKLNNMLFNFGSFTKLPFNWAPYFKRISFLKKPSLNGFKRSLFFTMSTYALYQQNYFCVDDKHKQVKQVGNVNPITQLPKKQIQIKRTFWEKIWNFMIHFVRFFQLAMIFTIPIVLSPLLFFKRTQSYWMDCFVSAVERAGVVWIKAFQYLSHRRDVIGVEMAQKFIHLRENAPTHTFEQTKAEFRRQYGKQIHQIFEQFNSVPHASGSVSQVYIAKYKGKKVAVKVRHPEIDKYIERDINLLFFFSYLASFISPAMQLPVTQSSLKKTLVEQVNFNYEMKNLNKFNEMFKESKDIKFPFPIEESTTDSVLVETFVEGVTVNYYEKNKHPLNKVIARLGSTAFFEMLMKYNFIHADCHAGNIFVQIQEQSSNFFTEIKDYFKEIYYYCERKIGSLNFDSEIMKKLYVQSKLEEKNVRDLYKKYSEKVQVTLIDVGMVISLEEIDKNNFVNFLKSVCQGKGEQCAQMIYNLSNFHGKKIVVGNFEAYYQQLKKLFSILNSQSLDDLEGMKLLTGMLVIIRENNMKLDGEFATLLTNMMVLEAIAKDIDPQINLLKVAFPYFKFGQKIAPLAPVK